QNVEYRVTLATLLQQAGRNTEAARHWSALIAEDDSRAAWWVGLAIALETGGEINSAVRAYSEAVQLPGLSPSLADYVRERLKSLQAG
ncbi:MAG: MSHA biogenesis protein MshN, partial [Marinobacter sp.]|nr:MSHA biogenesis protein MshN [Marinobacter sp.]